MNGPFLLHSLIHGGYVLPDFFGNLRIVRLGERFDAVLEVLHSPLNLVAVGEQEVEDLPIRCEACVLPAAAKSAATVSWAVSTRPALGKQTFNTQGSHQHEQGKYETISLHHGSPIRLRWFLPLFACGIDPMIPLGRDIAGAS